jgi:hypothetical protein
LGSGLQKNGNFLFHGDFYIKNQNGATSNQKLQLISSATYTGFPMVKIIIISSRKLLWE